MMKKFKQTSYKIVAMPILCSIVATNVVFAGSMKVNALETNNKVIYNASNKINSIDNHEFLIDSSSKVYDDMKKVQNIIDFKFKVPDFIPEGNKVCAGFEIIKLSDNDKALTIHFDNKNTKDYKFSLNIFEKKPVESLKKIKQSNGYRKDSKVEAKEQFMRLGTINGSQIILTKTIPFKDINGIDIEGQKEVDKYFVWENEGVYYSINYNSIFISNGEKKHSWCNIPEDVVEKIAKSIKYPNEINNVNYNVTREVSTEIGVMNIYDKEDLEKAKGLLGFNPKLPLKINEDIKIKDSCVGISGNSDIKNNKIIYELNSFYSNKNGSITFTAEKNSKIYEDIKSNGYFTYEDENNKSIKIKAEKMNINNNEVFKYEDTRYETTLYYVWKENNIYYSIMFVDEHENSDEIIKEFVNSKCIE